MCNSLSGHRFVNWCWQKSILLSQNAFKQKHWNTLTNIIRRWDQDRLTYLLTSLLTYLNVTTQSGGVVLTALVTSTKLVWSCPVSTEKQWRQSVRLTAVTLIYPWKIRPHAMRPLVKILWPFNLFTLHRGSAILRSWQTWTVGLAIVPLCRGSPLRRTHYYYYYYYKICIAHKFKHARVGGVGVAGWENGLAGEGK